MSSTDSDLLCRGRVSLVRWKQLKMGAQGPLGVTEIKQAAGLALPEVELHEYRPGEMDKRVREGDGVGTEMNRERNPE